MDKSPGSVRTVAWLHSDQTILSSCTDMGGVRYKTVFFVLLVEASIVCQYFTKIFSECKTDYGT